MLRERIGTTVTSLLGFVGVEADPIKSREHILMSTISPHVEKSRTRIWIWLLLFNRFRHRHSIRSAHWTWTRSTPRKSDLPSRFRSTIY